MTAVRPPPQLKACPFCGGAAKSEDRNGLAFYTTCEKHFCAVIGPERCHADAIDAWNRRATPDPDEQMVERVARLIEPSAWDWRDRLLRPFTECRGSQGEEPHLTYARAWSSGVRTAAAAHEWLLQVDDTLASAQLSESLSKARAVIAAMKRERG